MAGYAFWVLRDYKERMAYNRDHNGVSAMGLLTFDTGAAKLASDVFREAR